MKQCRQHKEGKQMPAYKDEKRNTWLSLFYYEDWQGNKKKKQKRGFKTKKHWSGKIISNYPLMPI